MAAAVGLGSQALGQSAPCSTYDYNSTFAFGYSWTQDDGACHWPSCCYYQHNACNGPLWIQYLSSQLGIANNQQFDEAVCGATAVEVLGQIYDFKHNNLDMSEGLGCIMPGGGDFLRQGRTNAAALGDDTFWSGLIQGMVSNSVQGVAALYSGGARAVLVHNAFDISRTPYFIGLFGDGSANQLLLRERVTQFNQALPGALAAFNSANPDLRLFLVDLRSQLDYVLDNAALLGFTQTTVDALDDPSLTDKSFTGPGSSYVFWDQLHATTKAHALFAQWAYQALSTPLSY